MEELKQPSDVVFELSNGVYDQIKDFKHWRLTKEQKSLVDKIILDKELNKGYITHGLCEKCNQPKNNCYWCRVCNFQQNFKNWTSGNHDVDKLIQKTQLKAKFEDGVLEWIEYDRFENVEYLAKGGFGTTFKAIWKDGSIEKWDSENNQWKRRKTYKKNSNYPVALKSLHNSQNITAEFLSEVESHVVTTNATIVRCYGITKDPETNNFMMVMEYAQHGSLRQYLNSSFNSLNWNKKIYSLYTISNGLNVIHGEGLIHHDFHCGNILNNNYSNGELYSLITDLGLCKPASVKSSQSEDKKIYGVLPYVAPEVLRGKEYTQESDIYGFGIIAYEVCTGLPPYYNIAHDEFLAIKICNGLRPSSNYKIPQLILDIIQKCWDADPLKRPKIEELRELFVDLWHKTTEESGEYHENSKIIQQIREAEEINKQLPPLKMPLTDILSYATHSQAIYTSRHLDFKNLPEPKNAGSNDNSFEIESYSESIKIDLSKLNINES